VNKDFHRTSMCCFEGETAREPKEGGHYFSDHTRMPDYRTDT
jgi:hypothetical protein